jgi:YHS domain-containing protein
MTILLALALCISDPPERKVTTPKAALQAVSVFVGSWKGTGTPEGTREEKAAGAWYETISWVWRFKGDDVWLEASFEKGKHFSKGELRYNVEKQTYQLTLTTPDKSTHTYSGSLKDKTLTLDRTDKGAAQDERLVFSLLHHNRHLYRFESRPAGGTGSFAKKYQVGATKEGVPFAEVAKGPECIVSGGFAATKISYKGKDYYVCCSGCRDAFKDEPEKYIKEAEEKAKKK